MPILLSIRLDAGGQVVGRFSYNGSQPGVAILTMH